MWENAKGRAAQPGMKTASQTDWGSGSESAMSKHKLAQSVMNQRIMMPHCIIWPEAAKRSFEN